MVLWQHGTYVLNTDGSMTLNPFSSDGRIQVQDPCAATTNVVTYYDQVVRIRLVVCAHVTQLLTRL